MELTDIEKEKLGRFWLDETMREAVRKHLTASLGNVTFLSEYFTKLNQSPNEVLGEEVKAIRRAYDLFYNGFSSISQFAPPSPSTPKENPAI